MKKLMIFKCFAGIFLMNTVYGEPFFFETFEKDPTTNWLQIDNKNWRLTNNSQGMAVQHIRYSGATFSSRPAVLKYNHAVCKFFNKKSVQIVEADSHISD